jgi:hypothetical protein
MAAPCAEPWTVENTRDWMDKTPTSTHDLSVWSSSSLGRWHPRPSVLLVLTRHSSPILNERWTRVINLSMFFLLCYDLTTILRSWALHRVLSSAIQYAWRSYMLSRLCRKVKTFRSDLLTYLKPTSDEIRKMMKVKIVWQGNVISCMKSFGKLNCSLCMRERIEILRTIRQEEWKIINHCKWNLWCMPTQNEVSQVP